jgi:RecB family exonuclease
VVNRSVDHSFFAAATTQDILDQIADLPADGPLPRRTIIVPRARVAHRLRCGLIERGRLDLLPGTAFVTVKSLATDVLHAAGVEFREGENELRLSRLRVLFRQGLDPEYFGRTLVTSTPGWEEALTRTIDDLEKAGLAAADLSVIDTPVGRGLAQVWAALDRSSDLSVTRAALVSRAAVELENSPSLAADWGATLAVVSGFAEGVEARLIRAIPDVRLVLRAGHPMRESFSTRVEALFGAAVRAVVEETPGDPVAKTDLAILGRYLFESPEIQSSVKRRRAGSEPDGSVNLEEHAGVAAEVEATADWVIRQVLEHKTPLEQIAVLVPRLDPLAQLVSDRLQRLPWENGDPVHVAGSCALTSTSSGGRILTVIEALRAHLSVDAVAEVLPLFRGIDGTGAHRMIPHGAAIDLAQSFGTVGGSVADPEGAMEWAKRLDHRESAIASLLEKNRDAEGDEENAGLSRGLHETRRQLRDLRVIRPALEQLVAVAAAVIDQRTLADIWPILKECLGTWVFAENETRALDALSASVEPACEDPICQSLAGSDALDLIESSLLGLRLPVGRFGDPAVYVGTVSGAVGLSFEAVRVIGLVDGTIPSSPQEDTVLSDASRVQAGEGRVMTSVDVSLRSQHELYQVVTDTTRELVLSAPRMGLTRSYREPSSLFLEVATALGRPAKDGSVIPGVPDLDAIRQTEVKPARNRAARFRRDSPIGDAAWQDRAAEERRKEKAPAVPASWLSKGALDLDRMALLQTGDGSLVMEGVLGVDAQGPTIPGMEQQRPLSASRWKTFLECPHQFFYKNLLGWEEPARPLPQRELNPLAYGSLFHQVLERFFETFGTEFWNKDESLGKWQKTVAKVAEEEFDSLLEHYPLSGDLVRRQQLARLLGELKEFMDFIWRHDASQFVAAERDFGFAEDVKLAAGYRSLYVRGFIDLIHTTGKMTQIWDFKTGRCHPKRGDEAGATPALDAQVALYGLVAKKLAKEWNLKADLQVAYVHTNDRAGRLRAFDSDFAALETAGNSWLEMTADLMAQRSFPRTTNAYSCTYCPFLPVCGPKAAEGSAAWRADADEAVTAFREMQT